MTSTLNAAELPLRGRHLIEASAGTGKTFTVANLYLRILIDESHGQPPTVENILVVTFTNAATEELRARMRSRIAVALQVLNDEQPKDADPTLHDVLNPHRDNASTRPRLELAYQCMDQAAIFTIHGFCERALREQAFESGELFDAELQADVDALRSRAAESWWRDQITPLDAEDTEAIPRAWRTPGGVLSRLSPVINDPDALLQPQFNEEQIQQGVADFRSAWQKFRSAWLTDGKVWSEQILAGVESKLITKTKTIIPCTSDTVIEARDLANELVSQETMPSHIAQSLTLLSNSEMLKAVRKGKEPLQSELGELIDSLMNAYALTCLQKLVTLQNNARSAIAHDLSQRKLLARHRTFDDLLLQLHAALYGRNGERLTAVLQSRFPVGLIDEFQDTDRIQYEIFDRLFPVSEESAGTLYLIGDPKQSIYRFRGADIGMYLRARDSANGKHSLDRNWRSSTQLINALNTLYAQSSQPFGTVDIHYQTVTAGGAAEDKALTVADEALPPLQFDWCEVSEDKLPNIDVSVAVLATACARRIAWLLNNATLGSTPVEAKDIAVLVSIHKQAQAVRNALLAVGVVSAMQSRESVFGSAESLDIMALLRVLSRPGDSASLSRVLLSPLGGYSAEALLQQRDDAAAWQQIEDAVQQCREQCQQAGPQAAILRFMSAFNSRVKALATEAVNTRGIDRILGNYLHLADVLQTAWQEQPELAALLKTAQRWREQGADEALQMRLESDEALVQIVTVHKSKGLQYPVVMLPFAFIGKDPVVKGDAVVFTENGVTGLDIGSDQQEDRKQELTQALQDESLRTLYVALTRAEQSVWIGAAANKHARHAALSQLLGLTLSSSQKTIDCQQPIRDALDKLAEHCTDISISEALSEQSGIATTTEVNATDPAREATRQVWASWRVGSYTGLARGATHGVEQPDHDAVDMPSATPETIDYNSPFHFPRGADAGTLVHAVFEYLDFRNTDQQALQEYAEQQLRAHGVDIQWVPALCQLVRNTLDTPLSSDGFCLSTLDKKDRLDELGFHFPVRSLQAENLVALLRDADVLGAEDDLSFDRLDGYMTGFIDLTFRVDNRWFIADYKSNHLGYDVADYHADALQDAMQHHRYDLQYLIYAVALKRYFSARMPDFDYERDFGGVYYLFVRGMPGATGKPAAGAESPPGIYNARPPEELLNELDHLLSGEVQHA